MVSLEAFNHEADYTEEHTAETTVVSLHQAGSIFDTLSTTTGRAIMAELCEAPTNPAAIAKQLDTSVQNVIYHLEKLEDAGLVHVVGIKYSKRGHEMDVYAPTQKTILIEVNDGCTADAASGEGTTPPDEGLNSGLEPAATDAVVEPSECATR